MTFTITCGYDSTLPDSIKNMQPPLPDDFLEKFFVGMVKTNITDIKNELNTRTITFVFPDKRAFDDAWKALERFSPLELKGMQNGVIERTRAAIQEK